MRSPLDVLLLVLLLTAALASCEPSPHTEPIPPRVPDACPPCPDLCDRPEAPIAEAPSAPTPNAEAPSASEPPPEAPSERPTLASRRSNPSRPAPAASPSPAPAPSAPSGPRVNINTASAAELERLPGVGPRMAERILEQRARRPFKSPRDLTRVKGIGRATFKRLEPLIEV